jgi:serine/threonine protein kinase
VIESLGRYRLDAFIGEGGMGRVYRAFDPSLGRPVAIKILPPELVHDRDRLERFIREARTASALNHPNVVTIYEIGAADDTHFIAMELLEGERGGRRFRPTGNGSPWFRPANCTSCRFQMADRRRHSKKPARRHTA